MKELSEASEKELLEMTSRGYEGAFRIIFDQYQSKIYSFAAFLTHSSFLAEEITQEVFLRIWQNRSSLSSVENINAYLRTISRNVALNYFTRLVTERKALDKFAERVDPGQPTPEEKLDEQEYNRILEEAVDSLPPQQKKVYLMHRRDGIKQEQIAAQLGISLHTVKEYMKKALAAIRAYTSERIDVLIFIAAQLFLHD